MQVIYNNRLLNHWTNVTKKQFAIDLPRSRWEMEETSKVSACVFGGDFHLSDCAPSDTRPTVCPSLDPLPILPCAPECKTSLLAWDVMPWYTSGICFDGSGLQPSVRIAICKRPETSTMKKCWNTPPWIWCHGHPWAIADLDTCILIPTWIAFHQIGAPERFCSDCTRFSST